MSRNIFIPGPTWVEPAAYQAMAREIVPHRSPEFRSAITSTQNGLKSLAGTVRPVYLSTTSSTGMMEAAVRNLIRPNKKVFHCSNGAFGEKWADISKRCGHEVLHYQEKWGQPFDEEIILSILNQGNIDALCIVHAETSTACINDLSRISKIVQNFPDVLLCVDAVSSFSMQAIEMDRLQLDVVLAGVQKGIALPPGLSICAVSQKALDRANVVPNRGFYLDFCEHEKQIQESMPISTPAMNLIWGLSYRMEQIVAEGIEARYDRHKQINEYLVDQLTNKGWNLFSEMCPRTAGLACFTPPNAITDTCDWARKLKESTGYVVDSGYGKLKGKVIRISNMGISDISELTPLIEAIN